MASAGAVRAKTDAELTADDRKRLAILGKHMSDLYDGFDDVLRKYDLVGHVVNFVISPNRADRQKGAGCCCTNGHDVTDCADCKKWIEL